MLATLLLSLGQGLTAPVTYYVATNGNDSNSGTIDAPFATLERARDTLRQLKTTSALTEGATVYVRGGTYYRTNTFTLDSRDSGLSTNAPVVFRAYTNEKPTLIGGLPITNFAVWKGKILKAEVAAQGFGTNYFRQLFYRGHRQELARYPNSVAEDPVGSGWLFVDGVPVNMYSSLANDSTRTITSKPGDIHAWARPSELEVFIFPRYNWRNNIVPVSSIDTTSRVINLAAPTSYAIRPGDRYYVRNAPEELDAPGEWYLDKLDKTLLFWPPQDAEGDVVAHAPVLRTLVSLSSSTANVQVQGFAMECCEGSAVALNNTTNCLIAGNSISNAGDYNGPAILISGGYGNGAVGNDIGYVGSDGISLSGGVTLSLLAANNYADNNYIHHTGVYNKQGVGVRLTGVGNRASHNLIHDCPSIGIWFYNGQNLVVEYNHIRNVCLETDDCGMVYAWSGAKGLDWISPRGSIVRYNYLHDSFGWGFSSGVRSTPAMCDGIYLDGFSSGVDVIGNVIVNASHAGVFVHGGRDNRIHNNIIMNCGSSQVWYVANNTNNYYWKTYYSDMVTAYNSVASEEAWASMRGMNVAPTNSWGNGRTMGGNEFCRNVVVWTNVTATTSWMSQCYLGFYQDVEVMSNIWTGNVVYHAGARICNWLNYTTTPWEEWRGLGVDGSSNTEEPLFVPGTFTLQRESPALALGFRQLPVNEVGPYASGLRASWPIREARGVREGFTGPLPHARLRRR